MTVRNVFTKPACDLEYAEEDVKGSCYADRG